MGFNETIIRGADEPIIAQRSLQGNVVDHLLRDLEKLSNIRVFASERMQSLSQQSEIASERMQSLASRIQRLSEQVPQIERRFHESTPDCFLSAPPAPSFARQTNASSGLFLRRKAPEAVNRRREEAMSPPRLNKLNRFGMCLRVNEGNNLKCMSKYSDPKFFVKEWIRAEEERAEKQMEQQQKRRKRKRKRQNMQKKQVEGLDQYYTDEFGAKKKRKKGVTLELQGREERREAAMSISTLNYGSQIAMNHQFSDKASSPLYQPGLGSSSEFHEDSKTATLQTPGLLSEAVASFEQQIDTVSDVEDIRPATPVEREVTPLQPPTPPVHKFSEFSTQNVCFGNNARRVVRPIQPPTPPVQTSNPAVTLPKVPVQLEKYVKMLKRDGVDERAFFLWLDPSGPRGVDVEVDIETLAANMVPEAVVTAQPLRPIVTIKYVPRSVQFKRSVQSAKLQPVSKRVLAEKVLTQEEEADANIFSLLKKRRIQIQTDFDFQDKDSEGSDFEDDSEEVTL